MTVLEELAAVLSEHYDGHRNTDDPRWGWHMEAAREVLRALRDPSDGMISAGIAQAEECTDGNSATAACVPEHSFTAMIDSLLESKP